MCTPCLLRTTTVVSTTPPPGLPFPFHRPIPSGRPPPPLLILKATGTGRCALPAPDHRFSTDHPFRSTPPTVTLPTKPSLLLRSSPPDVQVTVVVMVTVAEHITPRRQRATSNYTYSVRPSRASVTQC